MLPLLTAKPYGLTNPCPLFLAIFGNDTDMKTSVAKFNDITVLNVPLVARK
jgi:hypothetical protein